MFQGLRSASYYVADLDKATAWYTQALGITPYFSEPFYVGFNVGGFELGLHPDPAASLIGLGGAVPYWGVTDVSVAHDRLVSLGAETLRPVQDVGGGIRVAVVKDPFGNALGIVENPNFALP